MKRLIYLAMAAAVLTLGTAACKKAHDAGNDSMSIGHSRIVAGVGHAAE